MEMEWLSNQQCVIWSCPPGQPKTHLEVKAYWSYEKNGDKWALYRIYNDTGTKTKCADQLPELKGEAVMDELHDHFYSIHDAEKLATHRRVLGARILVTNNWSVKYDMQSVAAVMLSKPNMTFETLNRVVTNEGGYIDNNGIIHKGTACNKVVEL